MATNNNMKNTKVVIMDRTVKRAAFISVRAGTGKREILNNLIEDYNKGDGKVVHDTDTQYSVIK